MILSSSVVGGQSSVSTQTTVSFMFYNCENLFDIHDDPEKDDEEFLPGGTRGWNDSKYYQKLNAIAKVILSAGTWNSPELVGLCEVENEEVVRDLLRITPLKNQGYKILYCESDDIRGIDVCLLYKGEIASIITSMMLKPKMPDRTTLFSSRPVLYCKIAISGVNIHLFVNHWPSRRGGVLYGQRMRIALAETIRNHSDSIVAADGNSVPFVIAGDFNCNPGDREMLILEDAGFTNLSAEFSEVGKGTYRYRGVWYMFDQILVSNSMLNARSDVTASGFQIFASDLLMTKDSSWPGIKPFASFDNYRYVGGFSDHLPIGVNVTFYSHQ
jgi:hypothetical protein